VRYHLLARLYGLWGRVPLPYWARAAVLRLVNHQFMVGIAAVILDEQGRVLLFKHTYRPEMPWGLPGGWLKRGEEPSAAVEREVYEESKMRVQVFGPLRVRNLNLPGSLDIVFSGCYLSGSFVPSAEVCDGAFFPVGEFPPLYPSTMNVVEQALIEQESLRKKAGD
jgi:8-oxo-dGTP diphosphatase